MPWHDPPTQAQDGPAPPTRRELQVALGAGLLVAGIPVVATETLHAVVCPDAMHVLQASIGWVLASVGLVTLLMAATKR